MWMELETERGQSEWSGVVNSYWVWILDFTAVKHLHLQGQSQLHAEIFINKIFMALFNCLYRVHHSFQGSWKDETVIYTFDLPEIDTKSILHFRKYLLGI